MKTDLRITLIPGGLLTLAIGISVYLWWQLEGVEMGVHVTVALILGIVLARDIFKLLEEVGIRDGAGLFFWLCPRPA